MASVTSKSNALRGPGPRPPSPGPLGMVTEIRFARAAMKRMPMPKGENNLSLRRTWRARHDVLNLLLDGYYKDRKSVV